MNIHFFRLFMNTHPLHGFQDFLQISLKSAKLCVGRDLLPARIPQDPLDLPRRKRRAEIAQERKPMQEQAALRIGQRMHKRRQLRCRSGAAARVRRSQIREAAQDQGKAQTASRGRFRPFRQLPKASEQAFSPDGCRFLNGGGCSTCRRRRAPCLRQTRLAAADAG